jgi:uncharacterized protein HemX
VRKLLTFLLVFALATPAYAQQQTTPQPAPGSPFSQPVQDLVGQATTETTVTPNKPKGEDNGRGTLLLLSVVSLILIGGVGVFIWWESAKNKTAAEKHRRSRMRAGRPATSAASMSAGSRSGPPPPPRSKRRARAKRKKR